MITIVTVNYNNANLTSECVDKTLSVIKATNCSAVDEVVIVDNCSTDDSLNFLKDRYSNCSCVKVIGSDRNGGFGYGCNLGARHSKNHLLWFLNSDAWIESTCNLDRVVDLLDKSAAGAVSTYVKNFDGSWAKQGIQGISFVNLIVSTLGLGRLFRALPTSYRNVIVRLNSIFPKFLSDYLGDFKDQDIHRIVDSNTICGASFLITMPVFKSIEGFDEQFFLYDEDADLAERIKKSGLKLYVGGPCVRMFISATTSKLAKGKLRKIKYRSRVRLINKSFLGLKKHFLLFWTSVFIFRF